MRMKVLGKTGLKVSAVGFGGIPLQRVDAKTAAELLLQAEKAGINFIDTARGYTVSEELIGEGLEGRRKNWIIATKSMARDKENMSRDIGISLRNLKTDYIDLYSMHNIQTKKDLDRVFEEDGAYRALEEAKKEGRIGHIGLTTHNLDLAAEAIEAGRFETLMVAYNIVETKAEAVIRRAAELNIGVIVMKPLAGGAIEDASLALKYVLRNPDVTSAIPGMASGEEITQNTQAALNDTDFTQDELNKIKGIQEELGSEFCRRCGYCAPCPQGIVIPNMFLYSGYKKRYGLAGWAETRYASEKVHADACVQCGSCEPRCPYHLPIRSMMKQVEELFKK